MKSEIIKLNKIFKKYLSIKEINDIIIFGSIMKGKESPNDIDILIIFNKKINKKIEQEIRRELNNRYEINSITKEELDKDIYKAKEGLYLEGYSFSSQKFLKEKIGFESIAYLKYNLKNVKGSLRVRFYYSLIGRGKEKGFLSTIKATKFSENIIVCEYSEIEKLKKYFENWNIEYKIYPSLIPKRLYPIILKK